MSGSGTTGRCYPTFGRFAQKLGGLTLRSASALGHTTNRKFAGILRLCGCGLRAVWAGCHCGHCSHCCHHRPNSKLLAVWEVCMCIEFHAVCVFVVLKHAVECGAYSFGEGPYSLSSVCRDCLSYESYGIVGCVYVA
jgi:hypothetical protein